MHITVYKKEKTQSLKFEDMRVMTDFDVDNTKLNWKILIKLWRYIWCMMYDVWYMKVGYFTYKHAITINMHGGLL